MYFERWAYEVHATGEAGAAAARRVRQQRTDAVSFARAAGSELLWDLSSSGDGSAVAFIEDSLALPWAGPVRVRTVDVDRLLENHAAARVHEAQVETLAARAREEARERRWSLSALTTRQGALKAGDDAGAAAQALEEINAALRDNVDFIEQSHHEVDQRGRLWRWNLQADVFIAVRARARELRIPLVLDISHRRYGGESPLVYVAAALSPAADGGLRTDPVPEAIVRTVDLDRLYAQHPRTLAVQAELRDEERAEAAASERHQTFLQPYETARATAEKGEDPGAREQARKHLAFARWVVEAGPDKRREARELRLASHRQALLAELRRAAGTVAQRVGAHLVLDTSGRSLRGLSPIVFAAPGLDLTTEVARELALPQAR